MAIEASEAPSPPSHPTSHFTQQRHFYVAVDRLQFKMETLVDLLGVAGRRSCLPMVVCCSSRDELDAVCSAVSNLPYIFLTSLLYQIKLRFLWNVLALGTWKPGGIKYGHWWRVGSVARRFYRLKASAKGSYKHTYFWGSLSVQIEIKYFLICSIVVESCQYSDLAEAERALVLDKFRQATMSWNQNISAQPGEDSEVGKDEQKSHMVVVTDACLPFLACGESAISAHVLINYELPTKKEIYMRRMATCLAADGIVINMVVGGEVVTLKSIEESSSLVIAEMPINISEIL